MAISRFSLCVASACWAVTVGAAVFSHTDAYADKLKGCAAKTDQIEKELDTAQRAHADNARIAGLRVALEKSKQCDDKSLARERADKVAEKQTKVEERQATLDRETRNGDAKRINRAKEKLDHANAELAEARADQDS